MSAEMTPQARIRRLQDMLAIAGTGILAFSAWTLLKTILFFFVYDEQAQRQIFQINDEMSMETFYIAFIIIALIDLAIRVYVGMSARGESKGKRKGVLYLIVAAFIAIGSVSSIVLILLGNSSSPSMFDLIMTAVIEVTSFAILMLMIICAVRLRRLSKSSE